MHLFKKLKYFSKNPSDEVVELYGQTLLSNLAINLTYIFEPIFLYNLNYSIVQIMYFYVALYTAYALLIIPAAHITSRIGYKRAIFLASFIYVIYWLVLYQIKFHPGLFFVAPVLYALQKSFFWPAYDGAIALNSTKQQRGREVGVLFSLVEVASIVGPVLGGFISFQFGFPALFTLSAVLIIASVFPLFWSPEIYTTRKFFLSDFWIALKQYPVNFFAYWGYAEDLMLMTLWPIYMFLFLPQIFSIGLIVTVASIVAIVVMLYLGKLLDQSRRLQLLPIGAVFYGLTWVFRFLAVNFTSIVSFDILTRLGKGMVNIPMLATTYGISGKRGPDFALAYSVFYEFSLSIGKILTCLLAIWIIGTTGNITHVFFVVGILTMLYGLLKK